MYETMKKYAVKAKNLKDFCEKYHIPGKLTAFNREDDYNAHKAELEKYGYTIIPKGTSITGQTVSYYGGITEQEVIPWN